MCWPDCDFAVLFSEFNVLLFYMPYSNLDNKNWNNKEEMLQNALKIPYLELELFIGNSTLNVMV